MAEVRFHKELYDGFAIDEAVKAFGEVARFHLTENAQEYCVEISKLEDAPEEGRTDSFDLQELVGEFANYALGVSAERHGGAEAMLEGKD